LRRGKLGSSLARKRRPRTFAREGESGSEGKAKKGQLARRGMKSERNTIGWISWKKRKETGAVE